MPARGGVHQRRVPVVRGDVDGGASLVDEQQGELGVPLDARLVECCLAGLGIERIDVDATSNQQLGGSE